jgi:hypothetical protein
MKVADIQSPFTSSLCLRQTGSTEKNCPSSHTCLPRRASRARGKARRSGCVPRCYREATWVLRDEVALSIWVTFINHALCKFCIDFEVGDMGAGASTSSPHPCTSSHSPLSHPRFCTLPLPTLSFIVTAASLVTSLVLSLVTLFCPHSLTNTRLLDLRRLSQPTPAQLATPTSPLTPHHLPHRRLPRRLPTSS